MPNRNLAVTGPVLLASLLLAACGGGDRKVDDRLAAATTDSLPCTAGDTFPNVRQPVNFAVDDDNCLFHRWAWQEFVWLMEPSASDGVANFLTLANPNDLFVDDPLPYPGRRSAGVLTFMPRDQKDVDLLDPEAIHQAGDNGVLIDQAGQPVFYTILLDSTWYNFALAHKLYDSLGFRAAPDTLNFPTGGTGAIELKTAWRVAAVGDSTYIPDASSRFFTARGRIPTITIDGTRRDSAKFVTDTTRMRDATLALVGMHVVGTVPNHPEFIWATFEHVDNAPLCSRTSLQASARNDSTGQPWSLYPGSLQCDSTRCNVLPGQASFTPAPICRVNDFGGVAADSLNTRNIQSLNADVQRRLPGNSILRSYRLVGGQWTRQEGPVARGELPATFGPSSNIHGSSRLANLTMESFLQWGDTTCFSCHNAPNQRNPKTFEVSHVWPRAFKKSGP